MDTKTKYLGKLEGKVLLFGGVYSNLQALQALFKIAEIEGILPKNCISTGDLIGYCAQPEETILLFKKWDAHSITGNVEIQINENAEDCGCDFTEGSSCDTLSKQWYPFARRQLSIDSFDYLKTLPEFITFEFLGKKCTVIHGSYFHTSEFIFKSTPWKEKLKNFEATESEIIIAGHCGLPFHSSESDLLWLNPGVIGMPANDGNTSVWYMILEEKNGQISFEHKKLVYDYRIASEKMMEKDLPKEYADTLLNGFWDNMEILPKTEKAQQGLQIEF